MKFMLIFYPRCLEPHSSKDLNVSGPTIPFNFVNFNRKYNSPLPVFADFDHPFINLHGFWIVATGHIVSKIGWGRRRVVLVVLHLHHCGW